MRRKVVVLPQPEGPRSVTNWLSAISSDRSVTAATSVSAAAKCLERFLMVMAAIGSPGKSIVGAPLSPSKTGVNALMLGALSACQGDHKGRPYATFVNANTRG